MGYNTSSCFIFLYHKKNPPIAKPEGIILRNILLRTIECQYVRTTSLFGKGVCDIFFRCLKSKRIPFIGPISNSIKIIIHYDKDIFGI